MPNDIVEELEKLLEEVSNGGDRKDAESKILQLLAPRREYRPSDIPINHT